MASSNESSAELEPRSAHDQLESREHTEAATGPDSAVPLPQALDRLRQLAAANPEAADLQLVLANAEAAGPQSDVLKGFDALSEAIDGVAEIQQRRPELHDYLEPVVWGMMAERGHRVPHHDLAVAVAERAAAAGPNPDQLTSRPPSQSEAIASAEQAGAAVHAYVEAAEQPAGLLPENPDIAGKLELIDGAEQMQATLDGLSPDAADLMGTQEVQSDFAARMTAIVQQRIEHSAPGVAYTGTVAEMIGHDNLPEATRMLAMAGSQADPRLVPHMQYELYAQLVGLPVPEHYHDHMQPKQDQAA